MKKPIKVNYEIVDNSDPRFSSVKIWVAHTGLNLNGSYFSKEVLEEMAKTVKHIPIVGFLEVDDNGDVDFAGHEEELVVEMDEDGNSELAFKYKGKAIGLIPHDTTNFETKTVNGEEKEYLTVTGLIWEKFDESSKLLNNAKAQSMELHPDNFNGEFQEYEGEQVYMVSEATLDALCVLGDNHMPAMVGSKIEKFSMKSLKERLFEVAMNYSAGLKDEKEEGELMAKKKDDNKDFELTAEQRQAMLWNYLDENFEDLMYIESDSENLYVYNFEDGKYYGMPYDIQGEGEMSVNVEEKFVIVFQPVPLADAQDFDFTMELDVVEKIQNESKEEYEKLEEKFETLKSEKEEVETDFEDTKKNLSEEIKNFKDTIVSLKEKNEELVEYKAKKVKAEKESYVKSVENLDENEKDDLVENIDKYSFAELKDEVVKIIGNKSIKYSKKVEDDVLIDFENPTEQDDNLSEVDRIVAEYKKNIEK